MVHVKTRPATGWILSEYCASLILGAGLLTLPAEAAQVGLVPMLAVLLPVWATSRRCYLRLSRQLDAERGPGELT